MASLPLSRKPCSVPRSPFSSVAPPVRLALCVHMYASAQAFGGALALYSQLTVVLLHPPLLCPATCLLLFHPPGRQRTGGHLSQVLVRMFPVESLARGATGGEGVGAGPLPLASLDPQYLSQIAGAQYWLVLAPCLFFMGSGLRLSLSLSCARAIPPSLSLARSLQPLHFKAPPTPSPSLLRFVYACVCMCTCACVCACMHACVQGGDYGGAGQG